MSSYKQLRTKTTPILKLTITNYKTRLCIAKTVKNTQVTHFKKKKIVLILKNKIKGKSKCAICLTERTFIHEIEDKCGLESKLGIYLHFFTD